MPENMPTDLLDSSAATSVLYSVLRHAACKRRSVILGKDQLPAPRQGVKCRHNITGERNSPFAVILGYAYDAIHDGLADGELTIAKINILPPKAEQLPKPKAGVERDLCHGLPYREVPSGKEACAIFRR